MRFRIFIVVALLVVGIGAVGITLFPLGGNAGGSAQYITAAATRTNVVSQVVATGTIGPVATYSLTFGSSPSVSSASSSSSSSSSGGSGSSGSSASTWNVLTVTAAPGQQVKKGDVLATADASDAQLALTVANANLAAANARLAADKAGLAPNDKAAAALSITQAEQSLSQARTSQSQTIAQNNLKLSQQSAAVAAAKSQLATDQAANPAVPANVIAQDRAAITSAQNALASLKLQVAQSNSQAANQVRSAQLGVTSATYGYKSKTAPATAATIASDEAAVASAQQSASSAQARVAGATLTSPVDGTVLTVNVSPGIVAPSGTAISVQTAAMQVTGQVSETDLPSMKLGQQATITINATKSTATGTVTEINPSGSAASSGGVVSYGVVISLDQPPAGTASGMSAQVAVTTASANNVVAVPAIALVQSGGQYAVRVLDGSGQPQLVPVTVGLVTTSYAEIQSGITAGTNVVVGTSSARQGSTTTGTGIGGLGGLGGGLGGGAQFRFNGGGNGGNGQ